VQVAYIETGVSCTDLRRIVLRYRSIERREPLAEGTGARGWRDKSWLLGIGVVLYAFFGWLGLYLMERFQLPDPPGGEPPWYFIRRDAIEGLCFIPYLVACVLIGLIAIRQKIAGGATLIWFGVIWSAAPIWDLIVIYLRSEHIFDPLRAQTSWPTFESYMADSLRWGWLLVLLAIAIVHAIYGMVRKKESAA
jgi:hypothetical protein